MLKQINEDVEATAKAIASALEGLDQVTFAMDINVHRTSHDRTSVFIVVRLWFGHHFSKDVRGDDDIEWLARACRTVAEEQLAKMKEIVKANELTK